MIMKKFKMNVTKKILTAVLFASLTLSMLAGCGKKDEAAENQEVVAEKTAEAAETKPTEESVVEETPEVEAVTEPFLENMEKYDSIISTLTTDQYYGFAGIGEDYDVLLVTDGVYDYGDGIMAAIDATVYGFGNDGKIYQAGSVWSEGTAYPLAVYENSIMVGGNHHMARACVRDAAVIIEREADEVFDTNGNATYTYNDGDIDNIIEVEDDSVLADMYKLYEKATVINFFQGEAEGGQGCAPDSGLENCPSNDFEARVGKTSFESYDEIIGLLEGDEGYALVNVKGYDGKVLLVTTYTYDDKLGHIATTECTPYTVKSNGVCNADSLLFTGGTATPVKIDKDGALLTATHTSIDKSCYGENGTDDVAIMILATVSADELDDNGNPKSVYGFIRTKNSVIDDDGMNIKEDDIDTYNQLFDEYEKAEVVSFTRK